MNERTPLQQFFRVIYLILGVYGTLAIGLWLVLNPLHPGFQSSGELAGTERLIYDVAFGLPILVAFKVYADWIKKCGDSAVHYAGTFGVFALIHFAVISYAMPSLLWLLSSCPVATYRVQVTDKTTNPIGDYTRVVVPSWSRPGEVEFVQLSRSDWRAVKPDKTILYVTAPLSRNGNEWFYYQTEEQFLRHPKFHVIDLVRASPAQAVPQKG